jgi:uncharacterized protein
MSTQYNVSALHREPVGAVREYNVDSGVLVDEERPQHEQVAGHVSLLRTKEGVLVNAELKGTHHDQCSRCLREVGVPILMTIREEFFASVDATTGAPLPPPDDPDAFRIDDNHILDLEEAIRQAWTAALPMQPLCRPECAGLCPRCGHDLNLSACSCRPEPDERWSGLRVLARKMEGE